MQLRGLLFWSIRNGVMQSYLVSSLAPAAGLGLVFCQSMHGALYLYTHMYVTGPPLRKLHM